MNSKLIRISSTYFVAGLILDNGIVIKSAPIIKYMIGWSEDKVNSYIIKKGWKKDIIETNT